ncbi:MAG: hypothetical protein U0Q11_28065 [Vicinamibacterales bacterium]
MNAAAPLLDYFRRGEVSRDVRLAAAQGLIAPPAHEQAGILMLLASDSDADVRAAVADTLNRISPETLSAFLARADVPADVQAFFAARGTRPGSTPSPASEAPLIDLTTDNEAAIEELETETRPETVLQKLQHMTFTERIKAAMRGTREVRAILIRDSNKLIATSVLASPKVSEAEVEGFAKMATVSEDVLRTISMNRAWMKNYGVVLALTKNSKTPLAVSLTLLNRLIERDVTSVANDRNVPDPLRIAARRKIAASRT